MKKVLIAGGKGQLGQCIQSLINDYNNFEFIFLGSKELDITSNALVDDFFKQNKIKYCINCAAYTAVDKAEENIELANKINVLGVQNLALACKTYGVTLLHISTDFVFDGLSNLPYTEKDVTNPLSVYGKTKLEGEVIISNRLSNYYIFRTSWLYSEFENNFVKTMLKFGKVKDRLTIISDQIGTPTYAVDLARVLLETINSDTKNYGCYHYSNQGVASWYDFTKAIFDIKNISTKVEPIPTTSYPTPAKRPTFSVLNKEKITNNLAITVPYWRDSLKRCLNNL
ncbi:dTDP-4-dehydrorhamnose reductase [Psychroserpens sp. NJDZ02]|uniref:dTDP-4-dehydrorhamnose reductase n=1 Tax=Psychroserpens sp. NJDZ02 TaxID=2570561 RepID=UPI0010A8E6B6|nr:dTDP-4-dehydrorhamnose reductase [Psychroserpens sp. NJDZ02]QCE41162.1 dTDP-4-dehydrorhamnose reductase [Psychroserpens sp. NJDZ02]